MKIVYVVGPPCAGKSTYIEEHRGPADVVIDADKLAHTLGYPARRLHWPADDHPARLVMLRARRSAIKAATEARGAGTCWVVSTHRPSSDAPVLLVDPGRDVCLQRAADDGRELSTVEQIEAWYGESRTW